MAPACPIRSLTASERACERRPATLGRPTREDALLMAALRWFLFSLLAFGGGAVAAFAMHPPELGIPSSDAQDLRSRLALIEQYAGEGRCEAVKGQLSGAQSTVDKLPQSTNITVQRQLQDAIDTVRTEATSKCLQVAASQQTNSAEAQATTPTPTPTVAPTLTPVPTPTPDPGTTGDGAPDPGTTEGTTPDSGGAALPQGDAGAAIQQGLGRARERFNRERDRVERELDALTQELTR